MLNNAQQTTAENIKFLRQIMAENIVSAAAKKADNNELRKDLRVLTPHDTT